MTISKTIAAFLTAGIIGLFSFGSAQAIQPSKSLNIETTPLIQTVSGRKSAKCYVWKKDNYGNRYCYQYRYAKCVHWAKDYFGTRYCKDWKWSYYYGKKPAYKKHNSYDNGYGSGY